MRLFRVVTLNELELRQGGNDTFLEPTGETFTDTDEFIRHATDPNTGDKYVGKWQLQGKTESKIIPLGTITQCKLLIDETEGAEATDK